MSRRRSKSRGHIRVKSKSRQRKSSRSLSKDKHLSKDKNLSKDKHLSNRKITALIIVDMQYDFLNGGSLSVSGGNRIIPKINKLRDLYDVVILSKDWHPKNHVSFASTHSKPLFSMLGKQMLWPDHCIKGTNGAKIHKDLKVLDTDIIIKKGKNPDIDAYSAFFDNDYEYDHATKNMKKSKYKAQTKLNDILKSLNIKNVDVCGLAYDYCVGYTALDAKHLGYNTRVIKIATASVNKTSENEMNNKLTQAKVKIISKD